MLCRNDYVEACRELQCILRAAYVYAPELFQALLYEDVVHAFRTLARLTSSSMCIPHDMFVTWAQVVVDKLQCLMQIDLGV
jgi:hypothetical protein